MFLLLLCTFFLSMKFWAERARAERARAERARAEWADEGRMSAGITDERGHNVVDPKTQTQICILAVKLDIQMRTD